MLISDTDYETRTLQAELARTERQIAEMERLLSIKRALAKGIRDKIQERFEARRRRVRLDEPV